MLSSKSATLSNVPKTTDNEGKARFTLTNDTVEEVTVTVASGLVTQTLKLYFGATLNLVPKSVNAVQTATLTALLKDGNQK